MTIYELGVDNSMESSRPNRIQSPTEELSNRSNGPRNRLGRKRDSEWVFKPLKLKFKVKELEHLYNSAVYRQRQALLLGACILISILSLIILVVYLAEQKVFIPQ